MDYSYSSSSSSTMDPGTALAILAGYLIFFIVFYVVFSLILGRIFKKAGVEAWKAWVPVYNSWVFLELGGQAGYWAVLAFIPVVNIVSVVFMAIAAYHIGLSLRKEGWFVVLYILVPIVWYIWLAFDSSTWQGSAAVAANAAPSYQPPAPVQQPQAPQVTTPQDPQPNQNNTPPTPPVAF